MAIAVVCLVLVGVLGLLIFSSLGADAVLLGGLAVLVATGVIDPKLGVVGFANEGMLTVAALFVVAAGVRQTGAMSRLATVLLGRSSNTTVALVRLVVPAATLSAFVNNTPIVAALMPAVLEWCRRSQKPASRFLLPLSFATILGGTVTIVGTSTNLVVLGLMEKSQDRYPGLTLGIFDIAPVGIPVAIVGCVLLVALAPRLLPDRRPAFSANGDERTYTSEFLVQEGSSLVGQTIEEAGLRHLPGSFLAELDRGATLLPAVEPTTRLMAGDRLVFVGPREGVVDLQRIPGLLPAPNQLFKLGGADSERVLIEAVVAPGNPLVGRSIRDGEFRSVYRAVVVAVAREGETVKGKIGDIVLEAGDVLLMEAYPSWVDTQRGRRDFYLASEVADSTRFRHDRAGLSMLLLAGMVVAAATELTSMFVASVVAAGLMIVTGCLTGTDARRSVDWPVLVAIASAFGIGEAIHATGMDQMIAALVLQIGGDSPVLALATLYVVTSVVTNGITNNAAAALMFPFALSLADQFHVSAMPLCVTVMFAASAAFATPIGYQTNLMVYGPGGYRFGDFARVGFLIQIATGIVTCVLVPVVFPF